MERRTSDEEIQYFSPDQTRSCFRTSFVSMSNYFAHDGFNNEPENTSTVPPDREQTAAMVRDYTAAAVGLQKLWIKMFLGKQSSLAEPKKTSSWKK